MEKLIVLVIVYWYEYLRKIFALSSKFYYRYTACGSNFIFCTCIKENVLYPIVYISSRPMFINKKKSELVMKYYIAIKMNNRYTPKPKP